MSLYRAADQTTAIAWRPRCVVAWLLYQDRPIVVDPPPVRPDRPIAPPRHAHPIAMPPRPVARPR